jgi:hypothetical protein
MLGHTSCEVVVSFRELVMRELAVHAIGVQEVLRGKRDERVGVRKSDNLPVRSIEYWRSVEQDTPPG